VAGISARPYPEDILTAKNLTSVDAASELPVSIMEAPGQIGTAAAATTSTAVPSSVKVTAAASHVLAPPVHDVARNVGPGRYRLPRQTMPFDSKKSAVSNGVEDAASTGVLSPPGARRLPQQRMPFNSTYEGSQVGE